MKRLFLLIVISFGLLRTTAAQTIPKELWGTWVVSREVPTSTISCWSEKEAQTLIGSKIEYSSEFFRWNTVTTKNPTAKLTTITADQFHDANSGGSANGSQVSFQQLGIKAEEVTQIVIQHPAAEITGATIEIPGDNVLIKDKNTILFSVCNIYFEAARSIGTPKGSTAQRCGVDVGQPAQRTFADPDGKQGWREYGSVKDVPELELGIGQFASFWAGPEGKALISMEEPGEDFYAYTDYCFNKTGQLVAIRFELRTAWGWGYREDGPVANGILTPKLAEFFSTKNEAPIPRPEQAADIPDALRPNIYARMSRLPFAKLLSN